MNAINLRDQVRQAIQSEWPTFAANHPRLASALDETVLVEPAMQSLADDPEYPPGVPPSHCGCAGGSS